MGAPTLSNPTPGLPGDDELVIKQNEDFTMSLTYIELDELNNAVVADTSAWTVKMQVRKEAKQSSPVLVEASTGNGRIVVGIQGDPGEEINIDIKIPDTAINAIPDFDTIGEAGCDIQVIFPNGDKKYIFQEAVVLEPAYTW